MHESQYIPQVTKWEAEEPEPDPAPDTGDQYDEQPVEYVQEYPEQKFQEEDLDDYPEAVMPAMLTASGKRKAPRPMDM